MRDRGQVLAILMHRRELHDHRQVDAGDDLDAVFLQKRKADVARRAAEHVGEDDDGIGADALERHADFLAGLIDAVGPFQRHGLDDASSSSIF